MSEGVEDPLWTAGDRGPQRRPRADQALRGTIATPALSGESSIADSACDCQNVLNRAYGEIAKVP